MAVNPLTDTNLDLWKVTLPAFPWTGQFATLRAFNDYPMLKRMLRGGQPKTISGGTNIKWQVVLDDTGNARFVTPYEAVEYNASDVVGEFSANWALCHGYHLITDDELEENKGSATKLQNLAQIKREECSNGMFNKVERQAWKVPTGSAEEQAKQPFGLSYSIVPITGAQVTTRNAVVAADASQATGFFGGMNASGFSSCYGVDSSAAKYARYRNWCDVWTNANGDITESDVDKILRMLRYLRWTGPINKSEFESGDYANMAMYTIDRLMTTLERKARANNDNLGADLGKFAGSVVTKGVPYVWSQALEEVSAATLPLVAVDHNTIKPVICGDENFKEYTPKRLERQPRVMATDVYLKYNFVNRCRNRSGRIDYVAAS